MLPHSGNNKSRNGERSPSMINNHTDEGLNNKFLIEFKHYKKAIFVFVFLNICDFITTLFLTEVNPISIGNLSVPLFALSKLTLVAFLVCLLLYRDKGHWIKKINLYCELPIVIFNLSGLIVGFSAYLIAYFRG